MMKNIIFLGLLVVGVSTGTAGDLNVTNQLSVVADYMAADRATSNFVATGHVHAVASPFALYSDKVEKSGDYYRFAEDTMVTSCTNHVDCLHWSASGKATFYGEEGNRYAVVRNATLRLFDVPVMWFPFWYYPLDTDYGWRVMPGYTSKWGPYLLTKYVYNLAGSMATDSYGLGGATRFDVRSKNGVALGQSLNWNLGSYGRGKFKVYYAWDLDADRYERRWSDTRKYNYQNWGSTVPDERYSLMLQHHWDMTERDIVRVDATYYSDSHFRSDFLQGGMFGHSNRFQGYSNNEIAWEHIETMFGMGLSVSGPLNDFYAGVARLPEFYLDIAPQPIFALPANYESSSRIGFLNRDYAKYGTHATNLPFRYSPGPWADYQTFRFDTYHRVTAPFKVADVLSIVPRIGVRGTYYDRTGAEDLDALTTGASRAGRGQDHVFRGIVEGGVTFAARGTADLDNGWNHLVEPYLDVLAQEANYSGLDEKSRPFIFDSHDASRDYLDQFAGRSRNLPYSWYGLTPGIRNAFRKETEEGRLRTVFDLDIYAAIQFNDTEWYDENLKWRRLVKNPEDPNYGKDSGQVMPGVRLRWFPEQHTALSLRAEYDTEYDEFAYADLSWNHLVSKNFKYHISFSHRNHRWWDYGTSAYDPTIMESDAFNHIHFSYLEADFEHELCDAWAWGPFVRWDCRENELDEIGAWIDYRLDCLGFRLTVSYENEYTRIDGSKYDDDWRVGFYIYLRALGASSGNPF